MRVLLIILLMISIELFSQSTTVGEVIHSGNQKYLSNEIIIKFNNPTLGVNINVDFLYENFKQIIDVQSLTLLFPQSVKSSALKNVYSLKFKGVADPRMISSKLSRLPEIDWAEPRYIYEIDYTPNDPSLNLQWNLQKIKATQSFDYTKGDTNVVVGIIDTGIDWLHPDLDANIWKNYNETPNNNIDDDNNGYIDDVVGWDFGGLFGTPDNNPIEDKPEHGTHVAGITSAVSDNNFGISSIGFKTKLMAVKTCRNDYRSPTGKAYIIYGYEGIVYAVDNGADIVNCSWGGTGYSKLGQEVINYATENGCLVVAAAGNSNSIEDHFPSGYKNAFSVGATDEGDIKASFSNYGYTLDVSAPGTSIYSTWQGGGFSYASGTSMASPLAAGLIALVKAKYPNLTSFQCGELVRTTTDNINSVNSAYNDLMGNGRINAYNAVSKINAKSVRNVKIEFSDELGNNNGIIEPGETIRVKSMFINYLAQTQNLKIYFQSESPYVNIINNQITAGVLNTMQSFNNYENPFVFSVASNIPQNSRVLFRLFYSDGDYSDFEWSPVFANQTYGNQIGNNISLTVTSKGNLAFNDYPNNFQGIGMKFNDGSNLLYEGALILGNSSTNLSDAARGSNASSQNKDFRIIKPFSLKIPGGFADIEGSAVFSDAEALNPIGLNIQLHSYSFSDTQNSDYIILRYRLKNTNSTNINNFFAGLFLDWDIIDGSGLDDFTKYDETGKFGYANHIGGNPATHVGCAVISDDKYGYWGILNSGGDGGFSIYDGFSKEEKWTSISSGIGKPQAGGGDISFVVSSGPYSLSAGDSVDIAFALGAAENLINLSNVFTNARNKYLSIPTGIISSLADSPANYFLSQNYPNPFNPSTTIEFGLPVRSKVILGLYTILGEKVATLIDSEMDAGYHSYNFSMSQIRHTQLSNGIYFIVMNTGSYIQTKKIVLIK